LFYSQITARTDEEVVVTKENTFLPREQNHDTPVFKP
jgi:hypothetical protein